MSVMLSAILFPFLASAFAKILPPVEDHGTKSHYIRTDIITKEVEVPYPIKIEKVVPYPVEVPYDLPVPYPVIQPYPITIEKDVHYPVTVAVPQPYPIYKDVKVAVPGLGEHAAQYVRQSYSPLHADETIPIQVSPYSQKPETYNFQDINQKNIPVATDGQFAAVYITKPYYIQTESKVPHTPDNKVPFIIHVPDQVTENNANEDERSIKYISVNELDHYKDHDSNYISAGGHDQDVY